MNTVKDEANCGSFAEFIGAGESLTVFVAEATSVA
jgi:hypothetical protein